ncbi:MAG: Bug family tripartite tricarboxylate transporter substrate binding protein [Burkholderiales bacterium]
MKTTLLRVVLPLIASIVLVAGGSSWGQAYPTKPVRLIIGGLPGTAPDIIARIIAPSMTESMGQPLILDNRGGGAGLLGAQITAGAAPDGYTVLIVGGGSLVIVPFLTKTPPYDPVADFTPVTLVSLAPLVLASNPALPAKTVQELIGLSKAKPKDLLYGTPGVGSIHHLTIEMLNRAAGISLMHVPYKGGPPAVIDTIAGRVQVVITTVIPVAPHIKAARLRAIAVTSAKRTNVYPDVPTIAESGVPGFESHQWFGIFTPRNTPAAVRERFYKEVRMAVDKPGATAILDQEGQLLAVNGPPALAEFRRTETAKWRKIISQLRESGALE